MNGCSDFESRVLVGDDRHIDWNFDLSLDAERCIEVQVDQSVTWTGNFGFHPIRGFGGTLPNPIPAVESGSGDLVVVFDSAGVFGFACDAHAEMRGAIKVVD